jgi:hypothetical protein
MATLDRAQDHEHPDWLPPRLLYMDGYIAQASAGRPAACVLATARERAGHANQDDGMAPAGEGFPAGLAVGGGDYTAGHQCPRPLARLATARGPGAGGGGCT